MSTGLIAIAVIVGIGLIMGLFYVSHSIEKQKAKKALMIANLSEKAHRLQRLIDHVPAAYMPTELKVLILNEIKNRYEKLTELVPENAKFKKAKNGIINQISDCQASNDKPPPPQFKTPQEAAEIKASLQQLSKTVEAFVQNGAIQASKGQQHLGNIQKAFVEANVNYIIGQGDAARRENKLKLAVHHYQKATAELTKRNKGNQYSDRIEQLKRIIADLSDHEEPQPTAKVTGDGNELTKGMDDLLEEDNSWKKKYF
ncbi:MAG: hypothetical protein MI976_29600 [Pseudomonadales bacterium]|nr:hypothetical protein [Pseudomonadales bacterium]